MSKVEELWYYFVEFFFFAFWNVMIKFEKSEYPAAIED